MSQPLADHAVRERAATAADVNIVVTAGAGTGKTTLLLDRLTHLLFRTRNRVSLSQIMALTFTNKAASEMKVRLRQRLLVMQEIVRRTSRPLESSSYEAKIIQDLQSRYALTDERVATVAEETLQDLERAHIETIHSFAAYILRLFPVEAGVDPSFKGDDGSQFDVHFQQEWTKWLDRELSKTAPHRECWRAILQLVSLDDVQTLARAVLDELVPSGSLAKIKKASVPSDIIRNWIVGLIKSARALRKAHPKNQKLETMLDDAIDQLDAIVQGAQPETHDRDRLLNRVMPPQTKSWSPEDYEKARSILKVAQASQQEIPQVLHEWLSILFPFVEACQQSFLRDGWVSFNGLLAKVRDLLRDSPRARREIKQQFQAILVDEFQDTDPVQYELILYLAEERTREAPTWSQVCLEPGKLFIVGDPKQSIYAFRRADIEAYDSVIQDLVLGQASGGEQLTLRSNFRSHAGVLQPVNACCREWFPTEAIKGVQPRYEDLLPVEGESIPSADEGMQVRLVRSREEVVDADAASQAEAQELARWLAEEVFNQQQLCVKGVGVPIQPRHVAMLFRTLTHLRVYVDALRQYGIPYVTEGEKHFYERQEIVDGINLLRLLADPFDRVALVGVLRSPVGGCSDDVVAHFLRSGHLDDWSRKTLPTDVPLIFSVLQHLRRKVLRLPVADALDLIFQRLPVLELTAASMDGEQAVANVRKLQEIAQALAQESGAGFRGVVNTLTQWLYDPPSEAESSLVDGELDAQDTSGAVRLMSIHKAKGLEFPMVILAGLHRGADPQGKSIWVDHDWLTDCLGMRLGPYYSLEGVFLETKMKARQEAEKIRLLYVAMTRAQRRLVLSGGLPMTSGTISRGLLGMIVNGLNIDSEMLNAAESEPVHHTWSIGGTMVALDVVTASAGKRFDGQHRSQPWQTIKADQGESQSQRIERAKLMGAGYARRLFVTPTSLESMESQDLAKKERKVQVAIPHSVGSIPNRSRDRQALVGTLAHRVLQAWNFQEDPEKLPAWIGEVCGRNITEDWQEQTEDIVHELREMFNAFVLTAPYAILRQAEIIGREVSITVPWRPRSEAGTSMGHVAPAVLHGVIDVVYRWKDHIWVADYKTNWVSPDWPDSPDSMSRLVANYRDQAIAYREALTGVFENTPVRAHVIFLRNGSSIEV